MCVVCALYALCAGAAAHHHYNCKKSVSSLSSLHSSCEHLQELISNLINFWLIPGLYLIGLINSVTMLFNSLSKPLVQFNQTVVKLSSTYLLSHIEATPLPGVQDSLTMNCRAEYTPPCKHIYLYVFGPMSNTILSP